MGQTQTRMQTLTKRKTEQKFLKHEFTQEERNEMAKSLARTFGELRGVHSEFDQVKASFKSRIAEKESTIEKLSTDTMNGFDMRNIECVVVLRPKDKKKDFFKADGFNEEAPGKPLLIEDMTLNDFQQELIEAESKFEKREEIALFQATDRDRGVIVVGTFGGKWYSAIRISINRHVIEERLDSEQKAFKNRFDAIKVAAKRAADWFEKELKTDAKGFMDPMNKAIDAHRERVE